LADHRGLARTGLADDEDELALLDFDIDAFERRDAVLVGLRDVLKTDHS
jgi:hypothetical protein